MLQLHAMFYFCEQFDGNIRCDIGPFPNIQIISTGFNRDKGEISNLCWFLLQVLLRLDRIFGLDLLKKTPTHIYKSVSHHKLIYVRLVAS